ncbi:hypothetical protein KKE19_04060 [Patescibacteria group bacterium]|nr:hypothetical protein [Patescibacteria group bacterium]MBU4578677.1 hypothetical protein [Patescibacteria group bacterium]
MSRYKLINELFDEAKQKNILEYIFTLVRAGPIDIYDKDELLLLQENSKLSGFKKENILSSQAFWQVLGNLLLVNTGQSYKPYLLFGSSGFIKTILPLTSGELKEFLDKEFVQGDGKSNEWLAFTRALLDKYFFELSSFKHAPNFYKLPRFEVLETLVDDIVGLYGFKMYFSNGSNAEFTRDEKSTSAINLMLDDSGVGFQVGFIDKLIDEWKVGDKRLYELGLKGKYNKTGEWKPILYPGDFGKLEQEAMFLSKDERVQGILFYVFCTGYRVIEFVAKMSINLPDKHTVLAGDVHLENLTHTDTELEFTNEHMYDGWLELANGSIETIKEGVGTIQRAMQGLAFSLDNEVRWNLKYTIASHKPGAGAPKRKDVKFLNQIIEETQKVRDPIIDTAVSWYQLGILTQNPLNAFLCYHIAIEGLAMKLANGELEVSKIYGFKPEDKDLKNKRLSKCFKEYYDKYYSTDLEKMVKEIYFEGVVSLKFHLKKALEGVFGDQHPFIKEYFQGKESIWSLRGELAHGEYSNWHDDKYMMVWKKLATMQDISKSFLTRVILKVDSGKNPPGWTREHTFSIGMDDPRSTLAVSSLDVLPRQDWSIRPEWID